MFAAEPEVLGEFISLRMRCTPDEKRVALYDELFDIYRQAAQAISEVSTSCIIFKRPNIRKRSAE
jgi:hypothetical protein